MSSRKNFVSSESTLLDKKSLGLLLRFVRGLTLLHRFLPISLTCITLGAILPSAFLWILAEMAHCGSSESCSALIPYFNVSVPLNSLSLTLFVLTATAFRIIGWTTFEVPGQLSTRGYHAAMMTALGNTRTTYFDENPSGRLINRLVKDYDQMRSMAVIRIGDLINCIIEMIAVAGIAIFAHRLAGALVVPLILWVLYSQLHVSMMLQRGALFRSARFGDVLHRETDVIEGARVFLLYDALTALFSRVQRSVNSFIDAHLMIMKIEAWGFFWSGFGGLVFVTVAMLAIGVQLQSGALELTLAGAIATSLIRLTPTLTWFTWITAYLLESVGSIRRVFEIVDLPSEVSTEGKKPLPVESSSREGVLAGDLVFDNYQMSYRPDTPRILRGLSMTIPRGARVGIIGRTGAGKTSIMQSLFRMVYVQGGDIRIGSQSILQSDVAFARNHFAVIPQDPYLFCGTIASNIDPYQRHSLAAIEGSLALVGLTFSPEALVSEGGENVSRGERQLLCLARTVLDEAPFIIMDEPTSGIDTISDTKIQEVIAKHLRGKTLITIAHRVNTLMEYDLVFELEDGVLKRSGAPREMFANGKEG